MKVATDGKPSLELQAWQHMFTMQDRCTGICWRGGVSRMEL